MKLLNLFVASAALLFFNSCIEHEVIPAPKPVVELECSFSATINGTAYSLIEDVGGMHCESTKSKEINPSPQPSTATYNAIKKSDIQLDYVNVSLGKLSFNADVEADPSLEQFSTFFNANLNPNFSQGAVAGVEIVFRDAAGSVWFSNPASTNPQNFTFTSLIQESDELNDYMKFNATFTCYMYNNLANPTDSIHVENAVFKSHFKR
jgi:hypothetical protein